MYQYLGPIFLFRSCFVITVLSLIHFLLTHKPKTAAKPVQAEMPDTDNSLLELDEFMVEPKDNDSADEDDGEISLKSQM